MASFHWLTKYINGFLNSEGGGVFLCGVEETDENYIVEDVIFDMDCRRVIRSHLENIVRRMYPPVNSNLYRACFVPVYDPSIQFDLGNNISYNDNIIKRNRPDRYVFEVHVQSSTEKLHCLAPPLCFVNLCIAYARGTDRTAKLSQRQISHRLQLRAVPPPMDFKMQITRHKKLIQRREIDHVILIFLNMHILK